MNILNKVTRKELAKNKVRTLVTIIGIVLSVAMFTGVTTCISSLQHWLVSFTEQKYGTWYGSVQDVDSSVVEAINNDKDVTDKVVIENIGYASIPSMNENKPYIFIQGVSKDVTDLVPVEMVEGRLAADGTEITIPEHLATNGGVTYHIGDTITLDVGKRTSEGEQLNQQNPYYPEETVEELTDTASHTYTVVGIYKRNVTEGYSAPGYTALTGFTGQGYSSNVYIQTNKMKNIYSCMDKYSDNTVTYNKDLLRYSGSSNEDTFNSILYALGAILMALIIFGSVSLIYNAFSISVSERTRQFGILKSIGSTKHQMKNAVFYEALVLGAIGIPIGLLAGIGGIAITLRCMHGLFDSFLNGTDAVSMTLYVSVPAVVIAAAIGLVTVIISAWIPSVRASRKPAIEAIRQTTDISIKAHTVKTSRLTYKLFGFEGMLASKNFKRNRKKYRATVISLFLSVVLFISATSFCSYMSDSVSAVVSTINYDLIYTLSEVDNQKAGFDKVYNTINSATGVTRTAYAQTRNYYSTVSSDFVSDSASALLQKYGLMTGDNTELSVGIFFVQDEIYEAYLKENKLDTDVYMDSINPSALAYDNCQIFDNGKYRPLTVMKNDSGTVKIDVSEGEAEQWYTCNIVGKTDTPMFFINSNTSGAIILTYPYSAAPAVLGTDAAQIDDFYICSDNAAATYDELYKTLAGIGVSPQQLNNENEMVQANRALVTVMKIFSYGFIILISLIAVANVFNTISTNVGLRRREFAMLKSVGMTRKGFNKMMNFECLLYGMKGLIYGIPVSIGITFLIYKSIQMGWDTSFYMPWHNVLIAVASVFLVVFTTMLYSMSKVKNDNPVETLKQENL